MIGLKYLFGGKEGFVLSELLIVMAVIGVLAGSLILIVNPVTQIGKANDAKRKSDLNQLQKALETYYQDYGRYPSHIAGNYTINGTTGWGGSWPTYMSRLPADPVSGRTYVYYANATGQAYYLYAYLQAPKDPQMCFPATGTACAGATANGVSNSCGGTCNYGVSSANVTP